MLIDTHAHLYLGQFADDLEEVVDRARQTGVEMILMPAIDPPSLEAALNLCDRFPGTCYAMAAIHPSSVKEADERDLEIIRSALDDPRVVAVGESGIDYYWDQSYDEKQHDFLREHARMAIDHDLPLILHNRDRGKSDRSSRDLVEILGDVRRTHPRGERLKGIFHCFGPPIWLAKVVLDIGFHVGIGGTITHRNAGVPEAIADVPLERIVLETDAPYLAPAPHRGQRNEPAYVRTVAERLAEVRSIPVEEIEQVTTANASALFGLPT